MSDDSELTQRASFLDAYRGVAVMLMIAFHFCWNLKAFGYLQYSLQDPFWVLFRYIILALFLSAVGWSSYLAIQARQPFKRYILNLSKIGFAAMIISLGSYLASPEQWIFFGILHFIFLAAIIVRPFAVRPIFSCTVGVFIVFSTYLNPWFEASEIRTWFTDIGAPKRTLDYISPLPWLGIVLIGPIFGYFKIEQLTLPKWLGIKLIVFLGRYALPVYLMHQVILYPLVAIVHHLLG